MKSVSALLLTLLLTQSVQAANTVTLVSNGQANAVIILPDEADKDHSAAAKDLQTHIATMSGVSLDVLPAANAGDKRITIVVGSTDTTLTALLGDAPDVGAFALVVKSDSIALHGASSRAVRFAATELLEQLGCRWFMPGDIGAVIPQSKTVTLKVQRTIQSPSFYSRWLQASHLGQAGVDWQARMRCGGEMFPGAHGIAQFGHHKIGRDLFNEDPTLFAEIDGKRVKRQVCISNPKVLEIAVEYYTKRWEKKPKEELRWVGMGPNDGAGFCECENCHALDGGDWDAYSNEYSVTDRYIWFYNKFLDAIDDKFPNVRLSYYVYHNYMRPPVKYKPDPRIMPAYAPIALCRIHGPNNPICPEKSYSAKLVEEWCKQVPVLFDRGYWFNLADPGFPFIMVSRMREQIPLWHKLGIKGWRVESIIHWASDLPSHYIACKLMWNHEADVDALLADFHEKFFGPAAKPMANYTQLIDHRLRDADFHTGCSFDMPHIYDKPHRDKMRRALEQAEAATKGNETYAARVQIRRDSFEYLDAFVQMIESRNVHDYQTSQKALEKADTTRDKLLAHDPPLLNSRASRSYMRRFFRAATEQGYARTTEGNRIVAAFNDGWEFQLDPLKLGEDISWHDPMYTGGNWKTIKTSSSSWSNQGLRYYKGEAWYKQSVDVPAEFKGKKVFLWFGGVDEKVKVWLNGTLVGISPGSTFQPFEFDATSAVKYGEQNMLIIRLINERVNELGTGGLVSPVMLWSPADPNTQPENTRKLGETFP